MIIRAILIDPVAQTVTTTRVDSGLAGLRQAIGVGTIDIVGLSTDRNGNMADMIIDDDGLFVDCQRFFKLGGRTFAGKVLVTGSDAQGETVDCGLTLSDVVSKIEWLPETFEPDEPVITVTEFETLDELMALLRGAA
jgi:hypothetical protein